MPPILAGACPAAWRARSALLLLLLLLQPAPGGAQTPVPPAQERHRIGIFVTGLYGLDLDRGTFGLNFWIWTVGPDSARALATLDFVNASALATRLTNTVQTGPGQSWSQQRVSGTFRTSWDLRRYPFDRHSLELVIEAGFDELNRSAYEPDIANSGFSLPSRTLAGWRVRGMRVDPWGSAYPTTFGDPRAQESLSRYSAVRVVLDVERTERSGFFKLTAVLYAAFLLGVVGCLLPPGRIGFPARIALAATALLAMVLNMRAVSTAIGGEHGLTLVDALHVAGLGYVVAVVAATVELRRRLDTLEEAGRVEAAAVAVARDRWLCGLAALAFVGMNLGLVAWAAGWPGR